MIYKAKFYNQTGRGEKWGETEEKFTDCKAQDNPIKYCDLLGTSKYYNKAWFELSEYNPINKRFELFFCGENF